MSSEWAANRPKIMAHEEHNQKTKTKGAVTIPMWKTFAEKIRKTDANDVALQTSNISARRAVILFEA